MDDGSVPTSRFDGNDSDTTPSPLLTAAQDTPAQLHGVVDDSQLELDTQPRPYVDHHRSTSATRSGMSQPAKRLTAFTTHVLAHTTEVAGNNAATALGSVPDSWLLLLSKDVTL